MWFIACSNRRDLEQPVLVKQMQSDQSLSFFINVLWLLRNLIREQSGDYSDCIAVPADLHF